MANTLLEELEDLEEAGRRFKNKQIKVSPLFFPEEKQTDKIDLSPEQSILDLEEAGERFRNRDAQETLFGAVRENPDAYSKDKKTADRLNLPVEAVRFDKENTEAEIKSEDAMEAVKRSPILRKFLTDPVNARTSHDDAGTLSLIERIMQGTGRGVDIGQGLFYGAAEFAGEVTGIESLEEFGTEGRIENIQEAAEYGQRSQFTDIAGVGDTGRWIVDTASEQLPLMAPALAGSFAGAKLGLLAGPYAPIAVPVLAGLGAFIPSFIMGIGETQSALKEKDPDAEAHGAVLAAGTLIGSLDSLLPGKVGTKLMKGLGYDIAGEVSEEAVKKTLTEIAKKVTIATAKGSGLEGITESVQEAISEVAASAGVGEKVNVGELAHVMIEAFASGMLMGGGVTAVTNTYSDLVGRSKFDEEKLEALSNASKLSLLRERNPEKFNQVIKEMGEEYGTDTVYLDPEGAHTLFQSITLTEEGKTNETIQKILNEIPELKFPWAIGWLMLSNQKSWRVSSLIRN